MLPIASATLLLISMPLSALLVAQYLHSITSDNSYDKSQNSFILCTYPQTLICAFQPT